MVAKVQELNKEHFAVHQHLKYVELYSNPDNYVTLSLENTNAYSYIEDDYIYVNNEKVLPLDKIHIVGKHNIQNVMIGITAAKAGFERVHFAPKPDKRLDWFKAEIDTEYGKVSSYWYYIFDVSYN